MDDRLAGVAAANGGLITTIAAEHAGVPRAALRWAMTSGHVVRIRQGVCSPAQSWERLDPRGQHVLAVRAAQAVLPGTVAVAESVSRDSPTAGPSPLWNGSPAGAPVRTGCVPRTRPASRATCATATARGRQQPATMDAR